MTIVSPPYVLDFAAATVDHRTEFPPEILDEWVAENVTSLEIAGLGYAELSMRSNGLGFF